MTIIRDAVWRATDGLLTKRERWLKDQAQSFGLTVEQLAEKFALEIRTSTENTGLSVLFVEQLRLVPKTEETR